MPRLTSPGGGTVVDVADDTAERLRANGWTDAEPPARPGKRRRRPSTSEPENTNLPEPDGSE